MKVNEDTERKFNDYAWVNCIYDNHMMISFEYMPDITHVPARKKNASTWDNFYTEEEFIPDDHKMISKDHMPSKYKMPSK